MASLDPLIYKLKSLPDLFHPKYRIEEEKKGRKRHFSSRSFFLTMSYLVSGGNSEGILSALAKAYRQTLEFRMPSKSAFCQFRQKIHYKFFADAYSSANRALDNNRKTFLGLYIYAIDGQQLTLPRSEEIVSHGFIGRAISTYRESYMPKGFLTHAYDVLNGLSRDFTFSSQLHEQADARSLIQNFERNSLTIYDRLYFSKKMAQAHFELGNYFLMRARSNCHKTVKKLLANKKKLMTGKVGKKRIHFVKIPNTKNKTNDVYITNLPKRFISRVLINQLYRMRWEVETSFKELTAIIKAEQWHSKNLNGIMQELYTIMWLINATKGLMRICGSLPLDPTKRVYKKPNFKLIFIYLTDNLAGLWYKFRGLISQIKILVKESTERRKRCSRDYPRELKNAASPYKRNSTEWNWDKAYSLN